MQGKIKQIIGLEIVPSTFNTYWTPGIISAKPKALKTSMVTTTMYCLLVGLRWYRIDRVASLQGCTSKGVPQSTVIEIAIEAYMDFTMIIGILPLWYFACRICPGKLVIGWYSL